MSKESDQPYIVTLTEPEVKRIFANGQGMVRSDRRKIMEEQKEQQQEERKRS